MERKKTRMINGIQYRRGKMTYVSKERAEGYAKLLRSKKTNAVVDFFKEKSKYDNISRKNYFYWISKQKTFKNFDEFFNWFKYNAAKDLKLAYGHDWRKNEDFETQKEYIEIFMDYDFDKVVKILKKYNIKVKTLITENQNYSIYLK